MTLQDIFVILILMNKFKIYNENKLDKTDYIKRVSLRAFLSFATWFDEKSHAKHGV